LKSITIKTFLYYVFISYNQVMISMKLMIGNLMLTKLFALKGKLLMDANEVKNCKINKVINWCKDPLIKRKQPKNSMLRCLN